MDRSELRRTSITATPILFLSLVCFPWTARACSCLEISPSEAFTNADCVFAGTVIAYEEPSVLTGDLFDMGRWRFIATEGWKGDPFDTVWVYSSLSGAVCGFRFEMGRKYLVYSRSRVDLWGNWPEGTQFPILTTNMCSRTAAFETTGRDLAFLSEPTWRRGSPVPLILRQNRPNPFHPKSSGALTRIPFDLTNEANVSLRVYTVTGRLVRTLMAETLPAGRHERVWDGRENDGRRAASGIYVVELRSRQSASLRRIILLR